MYTHIYVCLYIKAMGTKGEGALILLSGASCERKGSNVILVRPLTCRPKSSFSQKSSISLFFSLSLSDSRSLSLSLFNSLSLTLSLSLSSRVSELGCTMSRVSESQSEERIANLSSALTS